MVGFNKRHPIILPPWVKFVELYIDQVHRDFYHANRNFVRAYLCNHFWLCGGPNGAIKRILRRCVVCVQYAARPATQIMGKLPIEKTTECRPFTNVGVDFFGPLLAKCDSHRSLVHFKVYGLIFVCFSVRAVHIEVCLDMSATKFLEAFQRFISGHGMPATMFSDNAKTFVTASTTLSKRSVEWRFIPPRTPHKGGFWEAAVKSAKSLLLRATNGQIQTVQSYIMLFTEIEGIMNSRPICAKCTGEQDDLVLTPGHFLVGAHLLASSSDQLKDSAVSEITSPQKYDRLWEIRQRVL